MNIQEIKIGEEVLLEQCWEDEVGNYHDEYVTIARILPNGQLKFRIGHWKTRKAKEQMIQAWINKFEWYAENITKL